MKCPYCSGFESSVLESRIADDQTSIRRRRRCESCKKRFTTYERIEGIEMSVIKKDGQKESFDREKIRKGIMKATWKRPVSLEDVEAIVDEIEKKLRLRSATSVKSWEIGNLIMQRLKKMDPVSYILFASVYKDFQSLDDIEKELERLKRAPARRTVKKSSVSKEGNQ